MKQKILIIHILTLVICLIMLNIYRFHLIGFLWAGFSIISVHRISVYLIWEK